MPGGLWAEKYGAKHVMGLGVFMTSVLTVTTPTLTKWGDATALIILQFFIGLCEGVIHPAISSLLAQWIAPQDRSFIGSLVYWGCCLGVMVSTSLSGFVMGRFDNDWPIIFHIFGGAGIVWFFFWVVIFSDVPNNSKSMLGRDQKNLREFSIYKKKRPFPWKHALTSKPFLALVAVHAGGDWCSYTIMTDLPKYMSNVLKLPIELIGYASSIHLISSRIFSIPVSWISDRLIENDCASITSVRKVNTAISSIGPGVLLIAAMYSGCNVVLVISLITIGLTLVGSRVPGSMVNVIDLSPNYAGTLMGIANGIGALCGIMAPYTVGVLAPNQTYSEWRLIFWIIGGVFIVTAVNFLYFASGDIQPWNEPESMTIRRDKYQDSEKMRLLALSRYRFPSNDIFYGVYEQSFD